jgi:hypothetical protein
VNGEVFGGHVFSFFGLCFVSLCRPFKVCFMCSNNNVDLMNAQDLIYIYVCDEVILHLGVDYIEATTSHVVRARAPPDHCFLVCRSRGSGMEIKA